MAIASLRELIRPLPGPSRDLCVTEIRNDSVTLSWKCPPYLGQTAISGYFLEVKQPEDGTWRRVNESETSNTFLKASGLTPHQNFVFRVHAVNSSGVGRPSLECGPVETRMHEGLEELSLQCDAVGEIFLCWKCPNTDSLEKITWSKNHEPVSESSNLSMKIDDGCTIKLIFKDPSLGDLGMYECTVDGVEGLSASYTITEKEMQDMLEERKAITDPGVPLKSGLAVELQDRGRVRLWANAKHLSSTCQARCIFNDNVISPGQKYDIRIDRNAGLVEILMDRLLPEDEGSYSVQLKDGVAESESTLVFIGEDFRKLLKESENMLMEWQRQQGPHFTDPLTWEVTQECNVKLFAKVGNVKSTTDVLWFKDDKQVMVDEDHDFTYGSCSLLISQITQRDEGIFSLELKDERGRANSLLDLTLTAFDEVIMEVCKMSARQASELKVQSSADCVVLYGLVPYYLHPLQTTWMRGNSKMAVSERIQAGVTENKIWIQIKEPTEKDKGHYTLELQAGDEMHSKVIDFSGRVFDEALQEHHRLKEAAIAEKNRAKVLGGLADVVTIMEGKSLNLTCLISGDPVPEVCWLKGKQNISSDERHHMSFDKDGYSASLIIGDVLHEDTGEYNVFVRNKHGSDSVSFTVSVYLPGQELPSSHV
uniref:myomesin-1-like n=1 Tax=Myxine glutinosa TaxID=7769 RepID=UPI00358F2E31